MFISHSSLYTTDLNGKITNSISRKGFFSVSVIIWGLTLFYHRISIGVAVMSFRWWKGVFWDPKGQPQALVWAGKRERHACPACRQYMQWEGCISIVKTVLWQLCTCSSLWSYWGWKATSTAAVELRILLETCLLGTSSNRLLAFLMLLVLFDIYRWKGMFLYKLRGTLSTCSVVGTAWKDDFLAYSGIVSGQPASRSWLMTAGGCFTGI